MPSLKFHSQGGIADAEIKIISVKTESCQRFSLKIRNMPEYSTHMLPEVRPYSFLPFLLTELHFFKPSLHFYRCPQSRPVIRRRSRLQCLSNQLRSNFTFPLALRTALSSGEDPTFSALVSNLGQISHFLLPPEPPCHPEKIPPSVL